MKNYFNSIPAYHKNYKKPIQRAGGYQISFSQFLSYEKSRWVLNNSSMYISNELKTTAFFNIFNFTSDVYNKFHIGLSQQHYPEDITHDDDHLSTKPVRQKRLEIMKMMVSEDITHDDDQLSTKPIRQKRLKIMKMMVSWKQKKILRKKRVFRRHRVLYFIFDRWCVMIYVSFKNLIWGYYVSGGY